MPDFYHGTISQEIFSTPDPSRIVNRSGLATNEYGWGFYTANQSGDAWERLGGGWGQPEGIIYKVHVPDDEFKSDFIQANQPLGQTNYNRLARAADSDPEFKKALAGITASSKGSDVAAIAEGLRGPSPKEGATLLAKAGIQGYQEGSYVVFFDPEQVKLEPYDSHGDHYKKMVDNWKETAPHSPHETTKPVTPSAGLPTTSAASQPLIPSHTEQLPTSPALNHIGQNYIQSEKIGSETLARAFYELKQLGNPQLLEKFKPILDQLHVGPYSQGADKGTSKNVKI